MARRDDLADETDELIGRYERGVSLRESGIREHVRRGVNTVDFGRFKNRDRRREAA